MNERLSTIGLVYLGSEDKESKTTVLTEYKNILILRNKTQLLEKLPQLDGVVIIEGENNKLSEVCELIMTIKKQSTCLIWIVLTSEKEMDKLVCLQLGADFVLDKESSKMEKEMIVKNALQRSGVLAENHQNSDKSGPYHLNNKESFRLISDNFSVVLNDEVEVSLTKLEFQLLVVLYQKPRMTFSYKEIQRQIYGDDTEDRQYRIANVIYHLRSKLDNAIGSERGYIKTIRSRGYMLDV